MKQIQKQQPKQKIKKVYEARAGAPFKQEDAQAIGDFIENCKDKTTKGIFEEIKSHPEHIIHSLFEWDKDKAVELYQLQRVRDIVSHIEINIISLGSKEPTSLNVSISAFKSVQPVNSEERVYVSIEDGMNNEVYRIQIIQRAKNELRNWMERYNQYKELTKIVYAIKGLLSEEE
jgi:hypothetical protein